MPDARISIPGKPVRGEPFEVRIQIRHPMETGYRTDDVGKSIPRNVIRTFACRYNGDPVFSARLSSGIAANPYLRFFVTARASGELTFEWSDDAGVRGSDRIAVVVA
ncbi:MAG: thiosulfate oxidation carrier complex protein SoxZ [Casimicrobiaceae bacterium]